MALVVAVVAAQTVAVDEVLGAGGAQLSLIVA